MTFDQLLEGFFWQIREQLDVLIRATEAKDRAHSEFLPAPYVSALMRGCLETAQDITQGGARYDFTSIVLRGLATTIDSLLALKTFVYDRREIGLTEYIDLVLRNFGSKTNSKARQFREKIIRSAPKYGSPEAYELTEKVITFVHEEISKSRNIRGGRYRLSIHTYGTHVIDGILVGSTPDGRLRGEPISHGVSQARESDSGPLDALKAAAQLEPRHVSSGISLNLRFHPSIISDAESLETFAAMIRGYFALGGMQIQPNFVSTEILREAQKHPERHRDLIVKVSGYSAHFVDLGRSIQDDIIERTEYTGV